MSSAKNPLESPESGLPNESMKIPEMDFYNPHYIGQYNPL